MATCAAHLVPARHEGAGRAVLWVCGRLFGPLGRSRRARLGVFRAGRGGGSGLGGRIAIDAWAIIAEMHCYMPATRRTCRNARGRSPEWLTRSLEITVTFPQDLCGVIQRGCDGSLPVASALVVRAAEAWVSTVLRLAIARASGSAQVLSALTDATAHAPSVHATSRSAGRCFRGY